MQQGSYAILTLKDICQRKALAMVKVIWYWGSKLWNHLDSKAMFETFLNQSKS